MRIILIDDHALFRSGLALILRGGFPVAAIDEYASVEAALAADGSHIIGSGKDAGPAVILLDNALEGVSGIAGIGAIRTTWPDVPIIIVSANDGGDIAGLARAAGADGFVAKSEPPGAILSTIRQVMRAAGAPMNGTGLAQTAPSARQLEILRHLQQGLSNREIGRRLALSEFTVRGHVQAILKLLEVTNRSRAVFEAQRRGLV